MSYKAIASMIGADETSIEGLFKAKVSQEIATKLEITEDSLERFIEGHATMPLASRLRITTAQLQKLRKILDRQGAIGFIFGLICNK